MKKRIQRRSRSGYISTPMVAIFALLTLGSLVFILRRSLVSHDAAVRSQVKVDYSQKEDAVLRALIALVPNKAAGVMQEGSTASEGDYTWETIFSEAFDLAGVEESVDPDILAALNLNSHISGNTGETSSVSASDVVSAAVGNGWLVNPGNSREGSLLFHPRFGGKLPNPLICTAGTHRLDQEYPIISEAKRYNPGWDEGLGASVTAYPEYNLIRYPNIRFGFARPGEYFVAKRNWWVFSITFGNDQMGDITVAPVTKSYVLSIYEIPTQLPLSAGTFMAVGRHEDGTEWNNVTIRGGVFANELQTEGDVDLTSGLFSGRRRLDLSPSTSIGGDNVNGNIDALGVREAFQAQSDSDFYGASLAANSGRVAIFSMNRGAEFFEVISDGSAFDRISPTGWNDYTIGANQCAMRIVIEEMEDEDRQKPVRVRFIYRAGAAIKEKVYTRGDNWPYETEAGGDEFPFQTESLTVVGREALVVHPERFPAFLSGMGASNVSVNNSLHIYPDDTQITVKTPSVPSSGEDMAVAIRSGEDLSAFSEGLSIISKSRVYFDGSFNQVPIAVPTGAGLPDDYEYFPPVSIFAPEKRYGTANIEDRHIEFEGQISSLKTESGEAFRPMDMKSGLDDTVDPSMIEASLKRIISPAELPPIYLMNWLVTIEEIQ